VRAIGILFLVLIAGCGSNSSNVARSSQPLETTTLAEAGVNPATHAAASGSADGTPAEIDPRLFSGLPPAALVGPMVTMTMGSSPVVWGKDVVVEASGFQPGEVVIVGLCSGGDLTDSPADEVCDIESASIVTADVDGDLLVVVRPVPAVSIDSGTGGCMVGDCAVVIASASNIEFRASVALLS